jgi:acetylornithine deacetylase/succinyl-diaminopimelate desuccinylase-like protein
VQASSLQPSDLGSVENALADATALLRSLIAEPSLAGDDAAVARCVDLLVQRLAPLGGRTVRRTFDGLECAVIDLGLPGAEPAFVLACHVDVVPTGEGWQSPPFTLTERDGFLVGRGVTDMKGGMAASLVALERLARSGALKRAAVQVVLTGDEEVGSARGMVPLLATGLVRGRAAICPEPTGLDVYVGTRGVVWLEVEVRGRGGHAGYQEHLANPLPVAAALVDALARLPLPERDERFTPPTPTLAITMLDANTAKRALNVIPDSATVGLDRRLLPGIDMDTAIADVARVVAEVVRPPFTAEIRSRKAWPPYICDAGLPLVRLASDAAVRAGRPGRVMTGQAAADSSWLGCAGIPTIVFGPGEPPQAHTTNERLAVGELRDAIVTYERLFRDLLVAG